MISPEQVEAMIKAEIPDALVQIQDLTGGGDHLQAIVVRRWHLKQFML
jgi:acid stress-induced BolA-like protein IbaG/YrbA